MPRGLVSSKPRITSSHTAVTSSKTSFYLEYNVWFLKKEGAEADSPCASDPHRPTRIEYLGRNDAFRSSILATHAD